MMSVRCITIWVIALGVAMIGRAGLAQQAGSGAPPLPQPPADNHIRIISPATNTAGNAANDPRDQYWYGVAVENIPSAISRQLKLHPDQGLIVVEVLADSPAARAGLKADDLLIEMNGRPLTSRDDLTRAANDSNLGNAKARNASLEPGKLVFLRDGDRKSVDITASPRPEKMLVVGNNAGVDFTTVANGQANNLSVPLSLGNYVAPNGASLMVGPGYQLNLQGQSSGVDVIRQAVQNGEAVVMTQETDPAGKVKNIISQGGKTYLVEPGHLDNLPENIRGLGQEMLGPPATTPTAATKPSADEMARQLAADESRIKSLETEHKSLEMEVERLRELVEPHPVPAAAPAPQK